jgi:hypothetical protein
MSDDLYDGPCEAGCISFHGGERKHHKDCGHYPHSLTKVNADRIEELEADLRKMALDYLAAEGQAAEAYQAQLEAEAKLSRAVEGLQHYACDCVISCEQLNGSCGDMARTALAELKGEDRG